MSGTEASLWATLTSLTDFEKAVAAEFLEERRNIHSEVLEQLTTEGCITSWNRRMMVFLGTVDDAARRRMMDRGIAESDASAAEAGDRGFTKEDWRTAPEPEDDMSWLKLLDL